MHIISTIPIRRAVSLLLSIMKEAEAAEMKIRDDASACEMKKAGTRTRFSMAEVRRKSLSAEVVDIPPV